MEVLVDNKDAWLFTEVYPNSGKETVILLHGGPGAPDGLGPVAEFLAAEFQVISFHQRGTANSPCFSHDYSIARYISDVDSIARHFNLPKFHLFGHSWGGLYAQLYAQERRENLLSLFLCSPVSGTGWQWLKTAMEIGRFNRRRSTLPEWLALGKYTVQGLLGSDRAYQRFQTQFCLNCNKGYPLKDPVPMLVEYARAKPANRTIRSVLLHPGLRVLPRPGFPTTVTYGDDDIYGDSPKYVRRRYPTAKFFTIPESGHFSWLNNEKAFFSLLADLYRFRNPFRHDQ